MPTSDPDPAAREALEPPERIALAADAVLGLASAALAVWLVGAGFRLGADPQSPHGGAFQILGAVVLGVLALAFAGAGVAVWRGWRVRWVVQAVPVLLLGWLLMYWLA